MVTLHALKEHVVANWIIETMAVLLTGLVIVIIRKCLVAFGKSESTKIPHWWILTASALVMLCVFSAVGFVIGQLEDIRLSSPHNGKFDAGLICASRIFGSTNSSSTNVMTVSVGVSGGMSGISTPTAQHITDGIDYVLVLRIANSGQPSVVWNWKVYVEIPTGQRYNAIIPPVTIEAHSPISTIIGPFTPTSDNSLLPSLATNPLATGAGKIGWLLFHLNGMDSLPYGSKIVVLFDDVFGRQTKIEHIWGPS